MKCVDGAAICLIIVIVMSELSLSKTGGYESFKISVRICLGRLLNVNRTTLVVRVINRWVFGSMDFHNI